MSLPWRAERRVGLCQDRVVLSDAVCASGDPVAELHARAGKGPLTVVLSNHLVRYAVLPDSGALSSREEWLALARHTFERTYGAAALSWEVRVSPSARGKARIATGVDADLLASLRAIPQVASIQPYLMAAFNRERKAMRGPAWLVLHEPGRLTGMLAGPDGLRSVRSRQSTGDLGETLQDFIERESALIGDDAPEQVLVRAEEEPPGRFGRFRVTDVTFRDRNRVPREHAMVLN